jgi:replicative DNA helicase
MRDLPHDKNNEIWLFGGVLQDPRIMAEIAAIIEPGDFYLEKHQLIWRTMLNMQKEGKEINVRSLSTEIKTVNASFDGDYIFQLYETMPSAAEAGFFADKIAKDSALRKHIDSSKKAISEAHEPGADPDVIASNIIERTSSASRRSCNAKAVHISESARSTIDFIRQILAHGKAPCIKTDFWELDSITGGLRNGELTIIGARPGVGKTSFALDIALNVACLSKNVLMFSLEMTEGQVSARAMCYYSGVNLKKTVDGTLNEEETTLQQEAKIFLESVPLRVIYERNLNVNQISTLAYSQAFKTPLSLVIVDHLQIVNVKDSAKNYENRNIALGEVTRKLKILSGELNCPVVALSQLNRESVREKTKPLNLSDLRDSGNIEQDADCVMLMHRLTTSTEARSRTETDIIVAKNRSGPTGDVKLYFDTNTTRFKERQC